MVRRTLTVPTDRRAVLRQQVAVPRVPLPAHAGGGGSPAGSKAAAAPVATISLRMGFGGLATFEQSDQIAIGGCLLALYGVEPGEMAISNISHCNAAGPLPPCDRSDHTFGPLRAVTADDHSEYLLTAGGGVAFDVVMQVSALRSKQTVASIYRSAAMPILVSCVRHHLAGRYGQAGGSDVSLLHISPPVEVCSAAAYCRSLCHDGLLSNATGRDRRVEAATVTECTNLARLGGFHHFGFSGNSSVCVLLAPHGRATFNATLRGSANQNNQSSANPCAYGGAIEVTLYSRSLGSGCFCPARAASQQPASTHRYHRHDDMSLSAVIAEATLLISFTALVFFLLVFFLKTRQLRRWEAQHLLQQLADRRTSEARRQRRQRQLLQRTGRQRRQPQEQEQEPQGQPQVVVGNVLVEAAAASAEV